MWDTYMFISSVVSGIIESTWLIPFFQTVAQRNNSDSGGPVVASWASPRCSGLHLGTRRFVFVKDEQNLEIGIKKDNEKSALDMI